MTTVAAAVLARLVSQIPGGVAYDPTSAPTAGQVPIFDGTVPSSLACTQWVVVYCDSGTVSWEAVDAVSRTGFFRVQTTSVAVDQYRGSAMAGWLSARVRDALVDWVPVGVTGWSCSPIVHDLAQPPRRDDDVLERVTTYAVDQLHLIADRA